MASKKLQTKARQFEPKKVDPRRRGRKPYPIIVFEEAIKIAQGIMLHASGNSVKRRRLLELMDLLPTSQSTRELITNSAKYGVTTGSYNADELRLTDTGRIIVDPVSAPRQRRQATFDLAIAGVEPFKALYDLYAGKPMPSLEVMQDVLEGLDPGDRKPCVDIFIGNAKFVGLLRPVAGSMHLLSIDDALDELARTSDEPDKTHNGPEMRGPTAAKPDEVDFERTCFFIAPIGDKKSVHRSFVWVKNRGRVTQISQNSWKTQRFLRRRTG